MKTKNQWWIAGGVLAVLVVATVLLGKSTLFEGAFFKIKKLPSNLFPEKTLNMLQEKSEEKKSEEKEQKKEETKKPALEEKRPDLAVGTIQFSQYARNPAQAVITVEVRNKGTADVERAFSLRVETTDNAWKQTYSMDPIQKDGFRTTQFLIPENITSAVFRIVADVENVIPELSEENNKVHTEPFVSVPPAPQKPDLSIQEYSYDATPGRNPLLKVKYRNTGTADTGRGFSITAKTVNGDWSSTVEVQPLRKDSTAETHFFPSMNNTNAGKAIAIIVDSRGEIAEIDEANNQYETLPLHAPETLETKADLIIESTSFERISPTEASIKVTVKNAGNKDALPFSVQTKDISENSNWESALILVNRGLNAGAETTVTISLRGQNVEINTAYRIEADATNVIEEWNEQNNKSTTSLFKISTAKRVTIQVSAYDQQNNNTPLARAHIYMFRVEPRNTGGYHGTMFSEGVTGARGEPASFTVLPGETVDFVVMKVDRNIQEWDFTRSPFRNFSEEDGVADRLCQINYQGNERLCTSSLNYPAHDQNSTARVALTTSHQSVQNGYVNMYRVNPTPDQNGFYKGQRLETKPLENDRSGNFYANFTVKPGEIVDFVGFMHRENAVSQRFSVRNFDRQPWKNFTAELSHAGFCSVNDPMRCNNRMSENYSLPMIDQDVEISVTAYSGNAGVPVANAAVIMYVMKNSATPRAPIVGHSIIATGQNGEGAKFKVKMGEAVQFKAFQDFRTAQRNTRPTFTTSPYKNFGPERPGRLCRVGEETNRCDISTLNIPIQQ